MPSRRRRAPSLRAQAKRSVKTRSKRVPWSAIRKHNRKRSASSLELALYQMLTDEGIPFVREKAIGRCHVDVFIEPNIVVEANGCYFHGHRCLKTLAKRHTVARVKDAKRYRFLRSQGYEVVVIWECDVTDHPEQVQERLSHLWSDISRSGV